MIPISYDFLISAICIVSGLYMLWRIGTFSKKKYTSALAAVTVLIGMVAWSIVGLVSFSGITEHPEFFYNEGWQGSWGYTSSRFFMAIMWLLALLHIDNYSPKCKKDVKARL